MNLSEKAKENQKQNIPSYNSVNLHTRENLGRVNDIIAKKGGRKQDCQKAPRNCTLFYVEISGIFRVITVPCIGETVRTFCADFCPLIFKPDTAVLRRFFFKVGQSAGKGLKARTAPIIPGHQSFLGHDHQPCNVFPYVCQ